MIENGNYFEQEYENLKNAGVRKRKCNQKKDKNHKKMKTIFADIDTKGKIGICFVLAMVLFLCISNLGVRGTKKIRVPNSIESFLMDSNFCIENNPIKTSEVKGIYVEKKKDNETFDLIVLLNENRLNDLSLQGTASIYGKPVHYLVHEKEMTISGIEEYLYSQFPIEFSNTVPIDLLEYKELDDGIFITNCFATSESVVFPSKIQGLPVIGIGDESGKHAVISSEVKRVILPYSVTTIENYAFVSDQETSELNVEEIVLSERLNHIDDCAFAGLDKLSNLIIPFKTTEIGSYAFFECTQLSNMIMGENVKELGNSAFADSKIKSVKLNSNLKEIPSLCFANCEELEDITIPNGIKILNPQAFINCKNLKEINLPNSLLTIEYGVFSGCKSLTKIYIPQKTNDIEGVNKDLNYFDNEFFLFYGCPKDIELYVKNPSTALNYAIEYGLNYKIEQ